MANADTFLVNKTDFATTKLAPIDASVLANVEAGEVLLKVDRFALTANNITRAKKTLVLFRFGVLLRCCYQNVTASKWVNVFMVITPWPAI